MTKRNRRRLMERKIVEQLVSGKSLNAICRELKVGKKRATHIREKARQYGYLEGKQEREKGSHLDNGQLSSIPTFLVTFCILKAS